MATVFNTIFAALGTIDYEFTPTEVEKMLLDSDIKAAIDQRKRGVNSRILNITSKKEQYKQHLEQQFEDLNLTNICDVILDSKFKGYSVQEIIYNNDLTMKELKEQPNE